MPIIETYLLFYQRKKKKNRQKNSKCNKVLLANFWWGGGVPKLVSRKFPTIYSCNFVWTLFLCEFSTIFCYLPGWDPQHFFFIYKLLFLRIFRFGLEYLIAENKLDEAESFITEGSYQPQHIWWGNTFFMQKSTRLDIWYSMLRSSQVLWL